MPFPVPPTWVDDIHKNTSKISYFAALSMLLWEKYEIFIIQHTLHVPSNMDQSVLHLVRG